MGPVALSVIEKLQNFNSESCVIDDQMQGFVEIIKDGLEGKDKAQFSIDWQNFKRSVTQQNSENMHFYRKQLITTIKSYDENTNSPICSIFEPICTTYTIIWDGLSAIRDVILNSPAHEILQDSNRKNN